MYRLTKNFIEHKLLLVFLLLSLVFLLLVFKDFFSTRTLIPNFEPYPDTFFYIVAPLNLIKGEGFYLGREGRKQKSSIPPLYSLTFLPFFAILPDPRMVYFANIFLAFISATLFFLILKRITTNIWIIGLTYFLYVTNYFLYWMPTLAMAENLLLPLYLTAILLLIIRKNSFFTFALLGIVSICIYGTKGASFPVSASILVLSILKILKLQANINIKLKSLLCLFLGFFSSFFLYALYLFLVADYNIIQPLLGYLGLINQTITTTASSSASASSWISFSYAKVNLPLYLHSLLGDSGRFLWDSTPITPKYIALVSIVGIMAGLITKKYRYLSLILITMGGSTISFLLTFYSFDARYIYIAIPSLLIGFSIFTSILLNLFSKTKFLLLIKTGLLIFFIFYLLTNFIRIKSQISLNLRYAETPWNYVAVLKMNEYFTQDKIVNGKRPILISALPPFLIDYFSNGNYTLLPLSYDQEFRGQEVRQIVWGPNDYSDLPKLYTKYLNEGYDLYVSRSGLGNEGYTNRDFNTIVSEFKTKLVLPGCYDQCNIYKVGLP